MRLKVEINDLTPEQWDQAQRLLKTEYTIPDGASRVCLTLIHGGQEWHLETPVSAFTSLLWGMSLAPAFKALGLAVNEAMRHVRTPFQVVPKVKNTGAATANGPGSFANTGFIGKDSDA